MSIYSKEIRKEKENSYKVINFMDGISYRMDPLTELKMVAASSIMGEPSYYRDSEHFRKECPVPDFILDEMCLEKDTRTTDEVMTEAIDNALDYDFEKTIRFAAELRKDYLMRLNPQVIMVRAAMHPERQKFNEAHPGLFAEMEKEVMARADEPSEQFAYWMYVNKSKSGIPSCLKRAWADKLGSLSRYHVSKYRNTELGIIDTVRICHAHSEVISELMKNGSVETDDSEKTWENLRSEGKTWKEIIDSGIRIGHMAALKNLRGIASDESVDAETMKQFLKKHFSEKEVLKGKQFPYRYWAAYCAVKESDCSYKTEILETLDTCMKYALENMPEIAGKTMILSDNSGSAWGHIPSEYGKVTVAEIGNLSAVLTAMRSDEGYVGVFGDTLTVIPVKKTSSVFDCLEQVNSAGKNVGMSTETGIWLFFEKAISEHEHWDNLFIYSDMQAGYGDLYCTHSDGERYKDFLRRNRIEKRTRGEYVDVCSLVKTYRKNIFRDINVFSIQTAGYNNSVLPVNAYRTAILSGWTGKEAQYAKAVTDLWNGVTHCEKTA